jgi:pimeloyl-ACP methyl ester carboxylesterase
MTITFKTGMRRATAVTLTTTAALATLVSCSSLTGGSPVPPPLKAAEGTALRMCGVIGARFEFPNTQLREAAPIAAGAVTLFGRPIAAHCQVSGRMFARKGIDGQDYAIGFEMRLPAEWNGRFFHQVNGGIDGVVQPAYGPNTNSAGALAQGFAVISSDAGHNMRQNPKFGEDPIARTDYGYGAVGKLTPMAKSLIAYAYGKGPDRSYIGGCSNGGRHTMVAASRYGDQYDGYLVGAPGYRLPNAALAQLWAAPKWAALATPGATVNHPFAPNVQIPDLGSAFTPQERETVAKAILGKCDALDGAADGMVQDVKACQAAFNLQSDVPSCAGARNGQCLTPEQKSLASQVFAGGKTPSGQLIYSSFPWDTGVAAPNWANWKFVNSQVLDPAAGYIFMSPSRSIAGLANIDLDEGYRAIFATAAPYTESADTVITPPGKENPSNLAGLRARGAKMLMYHGVSDAIFSANDTAAWWDRLNSAQGGRAADFARYFPVPGMAHCSGGPATDRFDGLSALVKWVEQGDAPNQLFAGARGPGNTAGANTDVPKEWSPTRTRPLCPYPKVARYNGSGDIEDAGNFSCK